MYIRGKKQRRKSGAVVVYFYAVQSYRDNGAVKQRTVVYIGRGPDVDQAIERERWRLDWLHRTGQTSSLSRSERRLERLLAVKAALAV